MRFTGFNPVIEGRFERHVKDLLSRAFISPGFFACSEVGKFRPGEDETIWQQKMGERAEVVEVYYKGEWICDVTSNMKNEEIIRRVWRLLEFNKAEKIRKE